jgi:ATP phosphoribosyltransferase
VLLGVPSRTSRFYEAVRQRLDELLDVRVDPGSRRLVHSIGNHSIVECRGRDLGRLVAIGAVDAALSGFDVYLESRLSGYRIARCEVVGSSRPTRLALVRVAASAPLARVYSEYPAIAAAWLDHYDSSAEVVEVHGSVEGLVATDPTCGGVTTVVSGRSLRDNGLVEAAVLVRSDLCLLTGDEAACPDVRRGGAASLPRWFPQTPGAKQAPV